MKNKQVAVCKKEYSPEAYGDGSSSVYLQQHIIRSRSDLY